MKITTLKIVLALCGLSVSAPAQVSLRADLRPNAPNRFCATVGGATTCRIPGYTDNVPRRRAIRGARRVASRGYYERVTERVWIDGFHRRVYRPAEYGFRFDSCGHRIRFLIRAAHYDKVWVPGRWGYRTAYRWVPARRACRTDVRRRLSWRR